MLDNKNHPVSAAAAAHSHLNKEQYAEMYKRSIENPEKFWSEQAEEFIHWHEPWKQVLSSDFHTATTSWFSGAKLNVSYNCIDRHLEKRGGQTAIIWEGDEPDQDLKVSYYELHKAVCRFANAMKARGVKKGDRVCIYMPMVPEAVYAMLACARIGAIHSVVFGGFSPESIKDRIQDSDCQTVITADEGVRGGRLIPLKANVDKALTGVLECPHGFRQSSEPVLTFPGRRGAMFAITRQRTARVHECEPELMDAEDPLFILYTSGSTGKPKGVMHTTAGYLLGAAMTHKYVFDYHDDDIYWCTADVGWVTGHSYIVYGPLANGAITLMFEGVPTYPDNSRFWQVVDKHKVNIFYTAPTAIRALMGAGDEPVARTSRASLRILGVGRRTYKSRSLGMVLTTLWEANAAP
jgi:acetyl-CoA synthetase